MGLALAATFLFGLAAGAGVQYLETCRERRNVEHLERAALRLYADKVTLEKDNEFFIRESNTLREANFRLEEMLRGKPVVMEAVPADE
jgi:hypothetical protein